MSDLFNEIDDNYRIAQAFANSIRQVITHLDRHKRKRRVRGTRRSPNTIYGGNSKRLTNIDRRSGNERRSNDG